MFWLKGQGLLGTLCDFAVNAVLHFRRFRMEKRRDKFGMMFSSKACHGNLQVLTVGFLPLSRGLLLHRQILLLILSSQSREHPESFDRPPGCG
jgi:hypothetical protein